MTSVADPSPNRYHYNAIVRDVHDGDTVTIDIDLGLGIWRMGEKVRLHGINAPEVTGPQKTAGQKSKAALNALLGAGSPSMGSAATPVIIATFKDDDDKFGRLLARIYVVSDAGWVCINDALIASGHAKPWDGQGAKP